MPNRNVTKVFNNVDEGFDAVFDAVRAGNESTGRIYRFAIDEMHRTQREQTELGRLWADAPLDVIGLSRAVVDTWQRRARRRAGIVRSMAGEMVSAGREARTAAEVVTDAGRSATRAGFIAGREAIEDAGDELRRGAQRAVQRAESMAGNGREEVRKAGVRAANAAEEAITDLTSAREQRNGGVRTTSGNTRKKTGSRSSSSSRSGSRSRTSQRRRTAS